MLGLTPMDIEWGMDSATPPSQRATSCGSPSTGTGWNRASSRPASSFPVGWRLPATRSSSPSSGRCPARTRFRDARASGDSGRRRRGRTDTVGAILRPHPAYPVTGDTLGVPEDARGRAPLHEHRSRPKRSRPRAGRDALPPGWEPRPAWPGTTEAIRPRVPRPSCWDPCFGSIRPPARSRSLRPACATSTD